MNDDPPDWFTQERSRKGMTWIELMVVLVVLVVLAGLLLPLGGSRINSTPVAAKAVAVNIMNAVKNYYAEYGVYPIAVDSAHSPTANDATFDSGVANGPNKRGHNGVLLDVLRAVNTSANPDADPSTRDLNQKHIVYFEYKDAKSPHTPRDGFVSKSVTNAQGVRLNRGDLVDPWGNLYCVRMDSGYTGMVCDPFITSNLNDDAKTPGEEVLHTTVICWSVGKSGKQYKQTSGTSDGSFESSGNVASWR